MSRLLVATVAVLALATSAHAGGWYLMVPPLSGNQDGPATADTAAPMSLWEQEDSYDNARDCGQRRDNDAKLAQEWIDGWQERREILVQKKKDDPGTAIGMGVGERMLEVSVQTKAAQCIASDDPRLAR